MDPLELENQAPGGNYSCWHAEAKKNPDAWPRKTNYWSPAMTPHGEWTLFTSAVGFYATKSVHIGNINPGTAILVYSANGQVNLATSSYLVYVDTQILPKLSEFFRHRVYTCKWYDFGPL